MPVPDSTPDTSSLLRSVTGQYITGILTGILDSNFSGRVYDPSAGCGELIARVLNIHREKTVVAGGTDSVISRLIAASDLVHASDSAPVHISQIRFIIVISIIGGSFRSPALYTPPLLYPFQALSAQVRTGNILYSRDLAEEYFSETAGNQAFRHIHPLDPGELKSREGKWSIVLSSPSGPETGGYPETEMYLARKYRSYQTGVHQSALLVERVYDQLAPEGVCIMFFPTPWLSEYSFRGFRMWVSRHLPAMIIAGEDERGGIDWTGISALVIQKKGETALEVTRFREGEEGKPCYVRKFSVGQRHLPDPDGWRLDDPWEEELLQRFGPELMRLSGYLFDEIYPRRSREIPDGYHDGWISVTLTRNGLSVHQGDRPEPTATAIIPGCDPYLAGLLTSSPIRWYLQVMTRKSGTDVSGINLIRNLPIRTIDEYSDDEFRIRDEISHNFKKISILSRLSGTARHWHDRERISRQTTDIQKKLDLAVCFLYGIPASDCDEIRSRVLPHSGPGP
jgi:hypothetical protein